MMCSQNNMLDDDPGRTNGGDATHIALAINGLCSTSMGGPGLVESALCSGTEGDTICRTACDCPDGTRCLVQGSNITCVTDCVDDTACADGFTCEGGICTAARGCFAGAIWERDVCSRPTAFVSECPANEVCSLGECVEAPPGDTCAIAEDLDLRNQGLPVDIINAPYRNLYQGSCGANGPDRVWRIVADRDATLTARLRRSDYRLYLRAGDCEDAATEVACSPNVNRPEIVAELTAGTTYYLFVDALRGQNEPTMLDILVDVVIPDGGPPIADAGMMVASDAGPEMVMDEGCSCRAGARSDSPLAAVGLMLLGLVVWRRRYSSSGS